MTPTSPFTTPAMTPDLKISVIPELTIGPSALEKANAEGMQMTLYDAGAPLSPFHYQLRKVGSARNEANNRPGACPTSRRRFTRSSAPTSTAG